MRCKSVDSSPDTLPIKSALSTTSTGRSLISFNCPGLMRAYHRHFVATHFVIDRRVPVDTCKRCNRFPSRGCPGRRPCRPGSRPCRPPSRPYSDSRSPRAGNCRRRPTPGFLLTRRAQAPSRAKSDRHRRSARSDSGPAGCARRRASSSHPGKGRPSPFCPPQ